MPHYTLCLRAFVQVSVEAESDADAVLKAGQWRSRHRGHQIGRKHPGMVCMTPDPAKIVFKVVYPRPQTQPQGARP